MGVARRTAREIGLALITLGVVVLLFVVYQLFGTNITEARNQHSLAQQFNAALHSTPAHTTASPNTATPTSGSTGVAGPGAPPATTTSTTAPASAATTVPTEDVLPAVPAGGAIEHLVIKSIGVDKYVVEGTDEADLRRGPGHYTGTAYPGQVGNAAIAGHRTTYGAPFFELNKLTVGDAIDITDLNGRTWVYLVSQAPIVVNPDDVSVLDPTPFPQLTLTTCNPIFSASTRLVVFARLKGQAGLVKAPPPVAPSKPTVLPGDASPNQATTATTAAPTLVSNLGQGRASAWPPSILYGLAFVVLWVATRLAINRARRWRRLSAYVVGFAVCAVPLWFCFENVILLLPQSI